MFARLLPILGITFIDILGFSILIPLMPYYVKHFGAPDIVVGILFSTFAACQLVAGPVWGNVSDRIGRKAVLIISQIGATIGWAMLAFAPSIAFVFAARIVEGVSGGNISVTQAYVADLVEPRQRARAFAWVGASFSAGIVLGPTFGGWMFARYGYVAPFLAAAALQLLTLIVTIVVLPESRSKDQEPTPGLAQIARSLRDPKLSPLLWQKLAYSLALYGWFPVFALVLALQLGFTEASTSFFFAGWGAVSVVYQLFVVGRLTDSIGDRRSSNFALAAQIIALLMVPFMHDILFAAVTFALFAFGLSVNGAAIAALLADAAPQAQRGTILGVGSSLESLSGVIMPPITTGVLGVYGVPSTVAICAAFLVGALFVGLRLQSTSSATLEPMPEPTAEEA
ncbi:MAG TPA: MFS transporter [Candidatus Binatia bacterium]|nr:MFS transporter [Candidatus Binatia bacterium]